MDTNPGSDPETEDNMTVDSDTVPTSFDTQIPEPTESESESESENELQQTIMTICNPLEEVASIRKPHQSNIFVNNPDPVQKPSWVKDSKCKHYQQILLSN